MRYQSTNKALSTSDWVSLSFSAIDQETITLAAGDDLFEKVTEELVDLDAPDFRGNVEESGDSDRGVTLYDEPSESEYEGGEESEDYKHDHAAWEAYDAAAREEIREREERDLLPMWSTMWVTTDDFPDMRVALRAAGFRLYDASEIGIRGLLIGIDGAGYDFYAAHWIPLRALCAADVLAPYAGRAPTPTEKAKSKREARALAKLLRAEGARGGEKRIPQVEALAA